MEIGSSADEEVRCEYQWSEISPSVAILKTIGVYENTDYRHESGGLTEPLYHYFDPDAFNTLIESGTQAIVSITLDDYIVEINKNTVTVKNPNSAAL